MSPGLSSIQTTQVDPTSQRGQMAGTPGGGREPQLEGAAGTKTLCEQKHGTCMPGELGACVEPTSQGKVGGRLEGWGEAKITPSSVSLGRIWGLT